MAFLSPEKEKIWHWWVRNSKTKAVKCAYVVLRNNISSIVIHQSFQSFQKKNSVEVHSASWSKVLIQISMQSLLELQLERQSAIYKLENK